MSPQESTVLLVIAIVIGAVCVLSLAIVIGKEIGRARRHSGVLVHLHATNPRALASLALRPVPPGEPRARDGAGLAGHMVQPLPPVEPRDSGAARVLAFQDRLARRGLYVDELEIAERMN